MITTLPRDRPLTNSLNIAAATGTAAPSPIPWANRIMARISTFQAKAAASERVPNIIEETT